MKTKVIIVTVVVACVVAACTIVYLSPLWDAAPAIRKLNTIRKPVAKAKDRIDMFLEDRNEKNDGDS